MTSNSLIKRIFFSFTSFLILTSTALGDTLCRVPVMNSHLARDQRDDLRMKCLKNKKSLLKVSECLKIADRMEYSTNAEDARLICLYELKLQPQIHECLTIAKKMEFADSGDEVRWQCLRHHNKNLSKKQCEKVASSMGYPANSERAHTFCSQEL